jgi:hypothetical protein
MEIRIDTKKDSKEEIKHAIEFLERFIRESTASQTPHYEEQSFNMPSTNMFDTPEPKTNDDFKILEY